MRRSIAALGLGLVTAVLVAGTAPAQAAPIRECGSNTGRGWTFGTTSGGGVFNLTTRRANCAYARVFAFDAIAQQRYQRNRWKVIEGSRSAKWTCGSVTVGYESSDIRCTQHHGRLVIHWQFGS